MSLSLVSSMERVLYQLINNTLRHCPKTTSTCICNPSTGEAEIGGSQGLTWWLWVSKDLNPTILADNIWRPPPRIVLWLPQNHASMSSCIHVNMPTQSANPSVLSISLYLWRDTIPKATMEERIYWGLVYGFEKLVCDLHDWELDGRQAHSTWAEQ